MNNQVPVSDISNISLEIGFDLFGVCSAEPPESYSVYKKWVESGYHGDMKFMEKSIDLRKSPEFILKGAKSVIVVGLNYYQKNEYRQGYPYIAKYALGRDYHKVLKKKLIKISNILSERFPEALFRPCVDSVPILEREYAKRAGLGWYGKNTCLINTRRGSWFFLGLLLTTLDIEKSQPAVGGCGTCRKCIDACPTGAIAYVDGTWQVRALDCISYLTIEYKGTISESLRKKIGKWTVGCDICQDVCPFNQPRSHQPLRSPVTKEYDFLNKRVWPSLVDIYRMSYEDWDGLTQGSPVRRVGYECLKRNAEINIDNEREK